MRQKSNARSSASIGRVKEALRVWRALGVAALLSAGICLGLGIRLALDRTLWAREWPWFVGVLLSAAIAALAHLQTYRASKPDIVPSEPPLVILPDRHLSRRQANPNIVAIGGGHGLSSVLRGLKLHNCDLTAIVTVADDGGSSGVLRREIGMPPPGDLRRCIAALAEAEPLMTRLFEYRFGEGSALDGHAFGNLFIAAMMGITGDFESAVIQSSRVLAVQGRIIPSSLDDVVLCAEVRQQRSSDARTRLVRGQCKIASRVASSSGSTWNPTTREAIP